MEKETLTYSHKDFESDQENRWCPGCGDKAILNALQRALPELGRKKEDFVFISGIGCSSRFPYYMNTYGFHTIHGRAPAIATGTKLANPNLSVWEVTGDGDALAIGGNHFIQTLRRNVDINILLFNNEIYGLTKGQFSPTSAQGLVTKSSPHGSVDPPFIPGELAIGCRSTYFARVVDVLPKKMTEVFISAEQHRGTSLIEILQNCVIFNDKVFSNITDKELRDEAMLWVEHGKPMIFGKDMNKGLVLNGLRVEIAEIGKNGITEKDILVHDAQNPDNTLHNILARMKRPNYPVVLGVIRDVKEPTFDGGVVAQIESVKKTATVKNMDQLMLTGETWEIE
ncbi:MAG: 2-oxoacid:ferredoxin oxidoreductase subunit beta [Vicingaceae bacterium]